MSDGGSCQFHDHTDVAVHHTSHRHELAERLAQAQAYCTARGVRLTPLRLQVLELVLASDQPVGAYDLLAKMATSGRPPAPPTVYRSLDFLLEQGLVHRLASINAYVPCCHPREVHAAQTIFLICTRCQRVSEVDSQPAQQVLRQMATQAGFDLRQSVIELSGYCQPCQTDGCGPDFSDEPVGGSP